MRKPIHSTYDRLERQKCITDTTGTRTFTYNDALQLAAETNAFAVLTRTHDDLGRSDGYLVTDEANTHGIAYAYSGIGKFSSLSSAGPTASNLWDYTYLVNTGPIPGVQPWTLPCAMGAVSGIKLFHGFAQVVEAQAFTVYGYSGFLPQVPPLPWIGPQGGLTLNPSLVGPSRPYEWRWRPYQNPNVR